MAQYKIPDPEELIPCPYDKVHMIRAKRMQYHLMKCRRNYAGRDFATCPFNARHEMPRPELRYHMSNCPDKAMIEPALSYESSKRNGGGTLFKGCTDVPAYNNYSVPQRENWDEEIPSVARIGVDPNFYLKLSYKDMTGMTKQQKKFYKQQMALPPEERQLPVDYQEPKTEEKEEEKRLRLPHQVPQAYMGMHQPQQKLQQPSQVFAYSMSMAGVGRGQSLANMVNQSTTQPQMNGTTMPPMTTQAPVSAPMFPGRGRGRGLPPPSLMMSGVNPVNPVNVTNGHFTPQESASLTNGYIMPQTTMPQMNGVMSQPQQATYNPTPVFTMGAGRGRGSRIAAGLDSSKTQPTFIVPHVNNFKQEYENQESIESEADSNNNEDSESTITEEDKSKTVKKIMKKLKQIEILEKKKSEGASLGEEEEMKISKKEELSEQLAALQI